MEVNEEEEEVSSVSHRFLLSLPVFLARRLIFVSGRLFVRLRFADFHSEVDREQLPLHRLSGVCKVVYGFKVIVRLRFADFHPEVDRAQHPVHIDFCFQRMSWLFPSRRFSCSLDNLSVSVSWICIPKSIEKNFPFGG